VCQTHKIRNASQYLSISNKNGFDMYSK